MRLLKLFLFFDLAGFVRNFTLYGGGSDGGGGTPYYANMDALYGAQSRAANYMLDNSMPYIPTYTENSAKMVSEAMNGTLANQMRDTAAGNTAGAISAGLDSATRNAQRFGIGSSTNRLVSEGNRNSVMGAATKAGAVNQATANAEDMKWNRNAGAFGQVTGMSSGAMSSLGSAASGYGAAGNAQNASDAQNAAGYGQFGAAVAGSLFKKDGGAIEGEFKRVDDKPGLKMALGGDAWSAYKNSNPLSTSKNEDGGTSALGAVVSGAMPTVAGEGLKYLSKETGLTDALKSGVDTVKGAIGLSAPAAGSGLTGSLGSAGAAGAMEGLGATGSGLAGGLTTGLSSVATTEGVAGGMGALGATGDGIAGAMAGAGEAGLTGVMGAASAALPWAAAIYGVGSLLDLWADGGAVGERKDFVPGGAVSGPGTETSDSIPSWLSKGEVVENADATKLAGKDALVAINNAGLSVRQGRQSPEAASKAIGEIMVKRGNELIGGDKPGLQFAGGGCVKPGVKMAGGGFLGGNLGIALGAGVQEFNRQKQADQQKAQQDKSFGLAEAQNRRAQEQFDTIQQDRADQKAKELAAAGVIKEVMPILSGGPAAMAKHWEKEYNSQNPAYGYQNGYTAKVEVTPTGAKTSFFDAEGKLAGEENFTNEDVMRHTMTNIHGRLASIDPKYAGDFMKKVEEPYMLERARKAKADERTQKNEDKLAEIEAQGKNSKAVAELNNAGRIKAASISASRPPSASGRAGLTTAEMKNYDFYISKGKTPEEAMELVTSRKRNTESWSETTAPNQFTGAPEKTTKVTGPGLQPKSAPADKFVVGKKYKDSQGNVGTYLGNGQWE